MHTFDRQVPQAALRAGLRLHAGGLGDRLGRDHDTNDNDNSNTNNDNTTNNNTEIMINNHDNNTNTTDD